MNVNREEKILSFNDLILELWKRKAKLRADGGELRVRAPKKANTIELHSSLLQHKEELLSLIRQNRESDSTSLPIIKPAPHQRYEPFPLNEVQQAYWIGRGDAFELGNIATHIYQEFESTRLNIDRLNTAIRKLVDRHDMLRAVILPDGGQKVLEEVPPYKVKVLDLRGEDPQTVQKRLEAVREKMSHDVLPAGQWPLFEVTATLYGNDRTRLHVSLDMLIIDLLSIMRLVVELIRLYINPDSPLPPLEITFRDYIQAEQSLPQSEIYKRSRDYWLKRIEDIPPGPELPLVKNPAAIQQIRFKRRTQNLDPGTWTRLKQQAKDRGLTPSGVLTAAYAEVLTYWNKNPRFTLNLTLFRRLPFHPQVEEIVGDFTSVTLLIIDQSVGDTFLSRARRIQEQLWKDLNYSYFSGIELLREIASRQGNAQRTLMPVIFTSGLGFDMGRDFDPGDSEKNILEFINSFTDHNYGVSQTPQVWLDHQAVEMNGELVFNWDIVEELFPPGLAEDMFQAYCRLLHQLAGEAAWTGHLELLPREQLTRAAEANATDAPIPTNLLHSRFLDQVKKHAGDAAVLTTQRTLTYQELYERANQVGRRLRQLGTQPNQLVAVVMEKGWEQVVAVLGILIAGSAYLPIDAGVPEERLWHLLEVSEVKLALTQTKYSDTLNWPGQVQCFSIDGDDFREISSQPLEPVQGIEDLAYVIFTSGSTGVPKGVVIDHRGAINTIIDVNQRFSVNSKDRVFAISNLNFDLSVYDIFGILAVGGAIVIPDAAGAKDPAHWLELVDKYEVTTWNSVPALMQMLAEYAKGSSKSIPGSMRLVLMSGDWIPIGLPELIRSLSENIELISMGGATEASIWSILYPIKEVDPDWPSIPYGKAMVNQTFFVLNQNLDLCPVWVPGQLYIGGIGLAKGYWRDKVKTNASFITHPRTNERLYKTGDLGRYLPDGNIEFLGREDFQVKISGYRIELGEIEAALLQQEILKEVVVTAVGENRNQKRLVAYLVLTGAGEAARLKENTKALAGKMRNFLLDKLPEYMIPEIFITLDAFPLTGNGKVDRKALPAPGGETLEQETGSAPPTTATEETVVAIWAEVLKLEKVGINDNFFMIGGDSLSGVRINNLVCQAFSIELSLRVLFEKQTAAGVSQAIDNILMTKARKEDKPGTSLSLPQIVPEPDLRHRPFPLTDMQQAYLLGRGSLFELGNVSTHVYNEFELDAREIDVERWAGAFQKLIRRHDMLRAVVLSLNEQKVLEEVPPYKMETLDLRGQDPDTVKEKLEALREEMAQEVMPADKWPLFKVRTTLYDENRVRLHVSVDMLILDFASVMLLFYEWFQYYLNPDVSLPPLELSYRDYVLAEKNLQDSDLFKRSRDYWLNRIDDLPPGPELPLSKNPGAIKKPRFTRRNAKLDRDAWRQLQKRAKDLGLTPSGVLLTAYAEVLAYWSKNPKFTINLTFASRLPMHPQVDGIIGDFTSVTLLSVDHSSAHTFSARAAHIQDQLWQDLDHPHFSGVQLLREIASREGGMQRIAIPVVFTSGLGFSGFEENIEAEELPGILGEEVYGITVTSQVWLDHQVFEVNGELIFNWDAVEELFPKGFLDDIFDTYCRLLHQLAAGGAAWNEHLQLLPREQLEQIKTINATDAPISEEMLHTLFLKQVKKHANHAAVIAPGRTLTYRELYRQANQVGHKLRKLGTKPNQLVGVVMEKGWEQVVAVLGILFAGSAYLPIDAGVPPERLRHLLEVSEVEWVLTQSKYSGQLELPDNIGCFCVDGSDFDAMSTRPLKPVQTIEDLAYVIFTSGSTGLPKGVVIDHRGAVNTIVDLNRRFSVSAKDRVFAISNLNFDLSVYDIFGILGAGGALVMPDPATAKDPAYWLELVDKHDVTIWNSVPALMQMLAEYTRGSAKKLPGSLRLVWMSGDWIPVGLPDLIRSLGKRIKLISMGGATEASIWSIFYPIGKVDPAWPSIPYGKPLLNQNFFVLNEELDPCPVWVPGNLYIGGIGVAKGYWRDQAKTDASFITHPRTDERLYKTGDLGRYLPDGNIEFLGREDFQVKIGGHRIELGEIESALIRHPRVNDAAAAAVGEKRDQKRLVGYVVPAEEPGRLAGDSTALAAELRGFLLEKLPDYMVPEIYVPLDAFPLTANGKVDRKALPKPGESRTGTGKFVEPRNDVERQLTKIWERIIKIHPIGVRDNFFQIGGNSLAAVQLVTEINQKFPGSELRLEAIYGSPTVEQMTALLLKQSDHLPASPLITIQPGNEAIPFVFVPGGGENMQNPNYYNLASLIGEDQPFLGLQPRGFGGQEPHSEIEEMAAYFIEVLRQMGPGDNFILGGWSFGGVIAYEMAKQLQGSKQQVEALILIDAQAPIFTLNCEDDSLLFCIFASSLGFQFGKLIDITYEEVSHLNEKEKLEYLEKKFEERGIYTKDIGDSYFRNSYRVYRAHFIAQYAKRYKPGKPLTVPAKLFRASDTFDLPEFQFDLKKLGINDPQKLKEMQSHRYLGWDGFLSEPPGVYDVPGDHYSIFREPNVKELAVKLRETFAGLKK